MNVENISAGEARSKIFCSIVMGEGNIQRGVLISRMHISSQTFLREYKDWLEVYPQIKYDKKRRVFSYEP